jgi:two-component system, OmpR family, alkaline phosphatase synthesis response regulator PhoP
MPFKILIADDEAFIRLLIEQTLEELENEGALIFTAQDGAEALEIIHEEKPDLVFLDVMMPKIDGYELCQIVKQNQTLDHICIVILTAKGQEVDRLNGEKLGADFFITKPFDPDELLGLAQTVMHR